MQQPLFNYGSTNGDMYSKQHYVIKFVWFPPPIKLT